jgi:catechol 2,3-dioxygenase-like lactoylglutathione lyase family enzyme
MILRIDHVSIAAKEYEKAERFFRQLMGNDLLFADNYLGQ